MFATPTLSVPAVETSTPVAKPGRLRRRLTSVLVALSLAVGTSAMTAVPAEAASVVTGCFASARAGFNHTGIPVQLQAYYRNTWFTIATSALGANQCVGFGIAPDTQPYYLRLIINHRVGSAQFYGSSPYWALPGTLSANVGTGTISCVGCV